MNGNFKRSYFYNIFFKPGIIKVLLVLKKKKFYVEDGIVEFKDNSLSILTSHIFDLKNINKDEVNNSISDTEKELLKDDLDDQKVFVKS